MVSQDERESLLPGDFNGRTLPELLSRTRKLIELHDKHSDRTWHTRRDLPLTTPALVHGFATNAINLSRAVLTLYEAKLYFEAQPLIRSTLECSVTAAWLALYPEHTAEFMRSAALDRRKTLNDLVKLGMDGNPGLAQIEETLAQFEGTKHDSNAMSFKSRCESLKGGAPMYMVYRSLCAVVHPTTTLADRYSTTVDTDVSPVGIAFRTTPDFDTQESWAYLNLCLLMRAQMAADSVQIKPPHATQLKALARWLRVAPETERATTA